MKNQFINSISFLSARPVTLVTLLTLVKLVKLVALLSLTLCSLKSIAGQVDIYRWVDKNNIVHFSQNLPEPGSYFELSTVSSYEALSKEARQQKSLQEEQALRSQNQANEQRSITAKNEATFKQNCIAAKQNIKMLKSFDEVLVTEVRSDGKKIERVLNDSEKQDKLLLSERHVKLYCQ